MRAIRNQASLQKPAWFIKAEPLNSACKHDQKKCAFFQTLHMPAKESGSGEVIRIIQCIQQF